MDKQFFKVPDGDTSTVVLPGTQAQPGEVAVIDYEGGHVRDLLDAGDHPLSTLTAFRETSASLVAAGRLVDGGRMVSAGENHAVWSVDVSLADVADDGDVAFAKPGVSGQVIGLSFLSTEDAGGSGAASIGVEIRREGAAARKVGATGNPATLDLTSTNVSDGGGVAGETIATGENALNAFEPGDVLVLTASDVTAFSDGAGIVSVTVALD